MIQGDNHAVQYTLTCIYRIVRDDCSRYDSLAEAVLGEEVFDTFMAIINSASDTYTTDRAAFLCGGLISRARSGMFTADQISYFVQKLVKGTGLTVSETGRLEALANVLKLHSARPICWSTKEAPQLLKKVLTVKSNTADLYAAVFCVWLLTFDQHFIDPLMESGIIQAINCIVKECKTEKVIRLATRVLVNSLHADDAVEMIIEANIVQVLTLLEYEKWRDEETYLEIQEGLTAVQAKIKQFSNFDRYKNELQGGKLKWSFLHSEKFWHENVMHFEENEFQAMKELVALLKSPEADNQTLSVACYDVGEFARLHPTAKRMLAKMQVKGVVMALMSHQDRDVCREALLCTQKLMLDRWQVAAGETEGKRT